MRCIVFVFLATLLCGVIAKTKKADDKVKIAIYYEALCSDSKKFITQQLAPVWRDFRGAIKVKLVPYGKATHDKVGDSWEFTCQHGPEECYGNKVQACILKDKTLQDVNKMELVICLMGQAAPDKSLDVCLEQLGSASASPRLSACARGAAGAALLAAYGDKSDAVQRPLASVPTVLINEKYDPEVQKLAIDDLKSAVCNAATNKPAACRQK